MKKATIGSHVVEYYDAIEDLPIRRYHKFNKMLLVDVGIGGDLLDADGHIERASRFMQVGQVKEAKTELENLRGNLYMIQSEVSPKFRAFAALIVSVDGVLFDDFSDDGVERVLNMLQDTHVSQVTATLEAVKKKISQELEAYFPRLFESVEAKEYHDIMKTRTIVVLDAIAQEADNSERIDELTTRLVTFSAPHQFSGESNAEIQRDKDFETMCHVIAEHTSANAKNMSVLEFYTAYEYAKAKIKAREKALGAK